VLRVIFFCSQSARRALAALLQFLTPFPVIAWLAEVTRMVFIRFGTG
jgi:hypothetical protein